MSLSEVIAVGNIQDTTSTTHVLVPAGQNLIIDAIVMTPYYLLTNAANSGVVTFLETLSGVMLAHLTSVNINAGALILFPVANIIFPNGLEVTRGDGIRIRTSMPGGTSNFGMDYGIYGKFVP